MKLGKNNFKLYSPIVMGICNVTPDSFSDGGKVSNKKMLLKILRICLKKVHK